MRKVVLKMDVSLDGFVNARDGSVDWIFDSVDDELKACIVDILSQADVHIMGRVTYQDMAEHWPSSTDEYAPPMNEIPKVVFSKTLTEVSWKHSRLANRDIADEISMMKQQPGSYILAHGGADFAQSLSRLGLIDEYRLIVHPVVLGDGMPVFKNIADSIKLKLTDTKVFNTGAILLTYQTLRNKESK
ncbi:dihydrofolate reductase family protein [Gracilibacillus alcaliphilus]|uniref:dihydrofolate reductase family protein n=1 Tax=Gracilibacillus alcaliphilus TaxID=1401441 RepID=UPI001957CB4B|nr:dihydrofolate reductase family protein [Gracilibacillus alcaliphilus]MBM7679811.1 dihydrofolate reductase [Gracilibacillus alcaliphilus]